MYDDASTARPLASSRCTGMMDSEMGGGEGGEEEDTGSEDDELSKQLLVQVACYVCVCVFRFIARRS